MAIAEEAPTKTKLDRRPIRIHHYLHDTGHGITIYCHNRHVSLSTAPYDHIPGSSTDVGIFNLSRQDMIDLAHQLLAIAVPIDENATKEVKS